MCRHTSSHIFKINNARFPNNDQIKDISLVTHRITTTHMTACFVYLFIYCMFTQLCMNVNAQTFGLLSPKFHTCAERYEDGWTLVWPLVFCYAMELYELGHYEKMHWILSNLWKRRLWETHKRDHLERRDITESDTSSLLFQKGSFNETSSATTQPLRSMGAQEADRPWVDDEKGPCIPFQYTQTKAQSNEEERDDWLYLGIPIALDNNNWLKWLGGHPCLSLWCL